MAVPILVTLGWPEASLGLRPHSRERVHHDVVTYAVSRLDSHRPGSTGADLSSISRQLLCLRLTGGAPGRYVVRQEPWASPCSALSPLLSRGQHSGQKLSLSSLTTAQGPYNLSYQQDSFNSNSRTTSASWSSPDETRVNASPGDIHPSAWLLEVKEVQEIWDVAPRSIIAWTARLRFKAQGQFLLSYNVNK